MQIYLDLLRHVLERGTPKGDRTGTGTRSVFGAQMRFDLAQGFPLLTTKKVHFKSVLIELLWLLRGDTNVAFLRELGVSFWEVWADAGVFFGPLFGAHWRCWGAADGRVVDQIADVVAAIKQDPNSRRLVVSAWNVGELDQMALPPCHTMFQFWVGAGRLSCQLYQRSGDLFLGVPFNIASYAALTMMMARACDLAPGEFVHTLGDVHLYENHIEQAKEQLARAPRPLPSLWLDPTVRGLFDFRYEHFRLDGYDPHPAIKARVAV